MGGYSIWLVTPTPDHPFNTGLKDLMHNTLPSDFPREPKLPFEPHVTITSDVDPAKASSAQEWLDGLKLPEFAASKNEVNVELEELESGDKFYKKVYIRAKQDQNLLKLAAACREQALGISGEEAQKWAETEYQPHLSLWYGDVSPADVKKRMGTIELQLGFEFGSLFACCGGTLALGARLVLADTSGEVKDWRILAEREAPWAMFKMARGLI